MKQHTQEWKEELNDRKCGIHCNHETSDEHYIVDKEFISNILTSQLTSLVEEIEKGKYLEVAINPERLALKQSHNHGLDKAITIIRSKMGE